MTSNSKRRKLNVVPEAPVSAFTARKNAKPIASKTAVSEVLQEVLVTNQPVESEGEGTLVTSSSISRAVSPDLVTIERSLAFSTFIPNGGNTKELQNGIVSLKLSPGERLIVLGEYKISVQSGRVALLHMTLSASTQKYRVFAPSSHSLPVIRCLATDISDAEISLHQDESGLRALESLSPLFTKMWNNGSRALGAEYETLLHSKQKSSFQILLSSKDAVGKSYLQPVISPPEWNELLAKIAAVGGQKSVSTLICGPKSSGKSTFTKLLINRLLSENRSLQKKQNSGVAVLDIDPGQPEYSTPGQLALSHITEPNFGPPFSHPVTGTNGHIIRAHTIGAITPSQDPDYYIACALDLFSHYRSLLLQAPNCSLIINTPGWVLGTGLEILVRLISRIRPTHVTYMSTEGPAEVVKDLQAATLNQSFYTLPSQTSEYTTRTAVHLRTMQTMSYFHVDSTLKNALTWSKLPLADIPPWELRYSGESSGVYGILCYGEHPPAELLLDSINGSLVAVVVIEDDAVVPGQHQTSNIMAHSEHGGKYQHPLIARTPTSNLPYFNPLNRITLSPQHSSCIGLALIRGIDIRRQRLQILTPIPPQMIEDIDDQGKKIVLVSGKFDTPGWAYTEGLIRQTAAEEDGVDNDNDDDEGERLSDIPWVEKLKGSQGRGTGARVWRVRRDLGRSDGGD